MNKKLFEDIGKRVKKRRIELGYTQEYLAEKMDVSIQMISGTESGKKALKLENFIKFCEILETTPDYLIKGRGEYLRKACRQIVGRHQRFYSGGRRGYFHRGSGSAAQ